jgi:hypothetical protein
MSAKYLEYFVQLMNVRTGMYVDDDTGLYVVTGAGTAVPEPLYSNSVGTSISYTATSIAQTMTDGVIRFWTSAATTSVDVTIMTASGRAYYISALTPYQHRALIDTEAMRQTFIMPFYCTVSGLTATGSAWSNGFSLPANSLVHDCWIRTSTLGTSAQLNVGVSGTPSGFLVAGSVGATGVQYPEELLVSATATLSRGTLLLATGVTSQFMRRSNYNTAATGLVFNNVTSTTLVGANGWIYIIYDKLPV